MSPRNHVDCVGNYSDAVLSSEIIAGRYVQLAVERHLDDLEHAHERGLQFDAVRSLPPSAGTVWADADVKTRAGVKRGGGSAVT